jgi:hypothetical protein
MKTATTSTTMTTAANSNTSRAAERSVAYLLNIRAEDARVLLVDAQSRVGLVDWGRSSCIEQVAAAKKVWNDLPLKDQLEIRNRMHQSRHQNDHPITTAAAASSSASSNMHPYSGNSNKYHQQEQQQRTTTTTSAVAAAAVVAATAASTTTTATTTTTAADGGMAAAGDVALELIPCLLECLLLPFS